jgi:hypothetical protein
MLKRPAIGFLCLAFAAILVFGLVHLFELRMSQGDVYPAYSTLRTDPLGASILYESLEQLPGISARRYFEKTFKEPDGRGRALLILGTETSGYSTSWMPRPEFETIQQFMRKGGRVVIAYLPEVTETWWSRHGRTNEVSSLAPTAKKKNEKTKKSADKDSPKSTNSLSITNLIGNTNTISTNQSSVKKDNTKDVAKTNAVPDEEDWKQDTRHYADLKKEWGFDVAYHDLKKGDDNKIKFPDAQLKSENQDLPALLPVHTAIFFTNLNKGWSVVYARDPKIPVVIERKFGAGSLLFVADSYPFSNESMFKGRYPTFLAWVLGGAHETIFDEAHLGVTTQPGVASLIRRYQLQGMVFSLALVAGLFVWKNSRSLVPPYTDDESDAGPIVMGRDSVSGFVSLVRRGVPPSEIINTCFSEWKQSRGRTASISTQQWRDIEHVVSEQNKLAPRARTPTDSYRRITEILKHRK